MNKREFLKRLENELHLLDKEERKELLDALNFVWEPKKIFFMKVREKNQLNQNYNNENFFYFSTEKPVIPYFPALR